MTINLTYQEARIIAALANNRLSAAKAARVLHYHAHTIDYHVAKIRRNTGLDPYDYYDMGVLLEFAKSVLEAPEVATHV